MKKTLINLESSRDKIKELLLEQLASTTFYDLSKIDLKLDASKILEETIPDVEDPTIYITPTAYIKMRTLVEETDVEIAWHGVVHKQDRNFVITDILVYPQKITSVTVESDDDLYPNWCMELPDEVLNNMRFQGHSHVNMGVTPSGVDEEYYTRLLTQVHDYYIIMVTNKHEAMTLRLYDVENNILYSDLDLNISREMLQKSKVLHEIEENLEKKIVNKLEGLKKDDFDKYVEFFKNFGLHLKFGIYESYGLKKDLLKDLIIYNSVNEEKMIGFKEYVDKMPKEQQFIYYASGKTKEDVLAMPQMDLLKKHGYDVLILNDNVDELRYIIQEAALTSIGCQTRHH